MSCKDGRKDTFFIYTSIRYLQVEKTVCGDACVCGVCSDARVCGVSNGVCACGESSKCE